MNKIPPAHLSTIPPIALECRRLKVLLVEALPEVNPKLAARINDELAEKHFPTEVESLPIPTESS